MIFINMYNLKKHWRHRTWDKNGGYKGYEE